MYSLVIPIYCNADSISRLLQSLQTLYVELDRKLEVVFVNDGSPDRSQEVLKRGLEAPELQFSATLVSLSRNFGAFAAVRHGLAVAQGPYFAVMAADLQEPPELALQFFRTLESEPVDVTFGVRKGRRDPLFTRMTSAVYWWFYRRLIQADMPPGGIDVFGCNTKVRNTLLGLSESNSSLVGQLCWVGYRRKLIEYDRLEREEGRSAWTLRKRLRYMADSAFAFSDMPIHALLLVGGIGLFISVALAITVLVCWAFGLISVAGYTPIMLTILFSTSLIVLALGILGGYLWRTFENTKARPLAIEMSRETFRRPEEPEDS